VVRFKNVDIVIEPKLAASNLGLVRMIEFTSGLDALRWLPADRQMEAEGHDLFDLLMLLFLEHVERLARGGFVSDYLTVVDDLPYVRGRWLLDRQLSRRYGQVDKVICEYDEFGQNVVENQLLAYAILRCSPRLRSRELRARARRLSALLDEICDPLALPREALRGRLHYHRLNRRYRPAHDLALILLQHLGIEDVLSQAAISGFAFLLDMNQLFERFVAILLERTFPERTIRVIAQQSDPLALIRGSTGRSYASIRPDAILEIGGRAHRLPVDAKYKRYSKRKVDPADVYQLFLYAYAYGSRDGGLRAALLYPAESPELEQDTVTVEGGERMMRGRIEVIGVPVARLLEELRSPRWPIIDALRACLVPTPGTQLRRPTLVTGSGLNSIQPLMSKRE
jgi:5-methylcytosine-specific restriction enzyme subunit McrC